MSIIQTPAPASPTMSHRALADAFTNAVYIRQAMLRVDPGLALTPVLLEREVIWTLAELRTTDRGGIFWQAMNIGRRLFTCLCEAQNHRCCWCGVRMDEMAPDKRDRPTFEHVIPLSDGGTDSPDDNLAVACRACNLGRAAPISYSFKRWRADAPQRFQVVERPTARHGSPALAA